MEPLLVDTSRGFTIKYKGRFLYSSVNPLYAALRRVERVCLELNENTLIFVPSLGLGYGIKELLQRLPPHCHILCIEADQHLMGFTLKTGIVNLPKDQRLTIIRTDDPSEAAKRAHSLGLFNFRRVKPLFLCGGYHLHKNTYQRMQEVLEEEIRIFWQNKMTLINMSKLWVKNLFANLKSLSIAGDLNSLATHKPIVVAGAGPSLEESLDWIKKIRKRVLILAVDTALPVLMDVGLKPDYVFMLEAQHSNLQDFLPYGIYDNSGIALICDITANPLIIRLFKNRVYFFSSRFYPLKLFNRLKNFGLLPASLPPLGSVGVAAVHSALKTTGGPVLITGLDFSYIACKTHARGAPVNRTMYFTANRLQPPGMLSFEAILKRPLLKLKGKGGRDILSDLILRSYSLQLRKEIKDTGRVFDMAKEGMATDVPAVHSEKDLLKICGLIKPSTYPLDQESKKMLFSPSLESVASFYRSEKELLLRAEEQLKSLLNQKDAGDIPVAEFKTEILQDIEYAFLHFPDTLPELKITRLFISRALLSIRYYISRLQRLSSCM